jgi:hypothetical protein
VGYKDYYSAIRNGLQNPVGNAFLFDGHGPSSRAQTSDLYFPVVRATEGCAKFAAATSTSDPAPGRELCDACRSLLWNAKELGAFEHCAGYPKVSSGKSKTLGANSDSTLGANSDSTLGANSDSTLGANSGKNLGANSDSTLGANSEKDLGANSDSTLGANSDSTLGANSDSTLGTSGGDFLGFSGSGLTLGSGKSSIYTRRPSDEFEMIARLARAVVYAGDRQIEGTVRARLPMLGDVKTPPMVVLDSCHGTDQIANELFQVADPATPVVTVFNPNAMGLAALRYDALNYAHLLAFPWLQAAYHFDPRHGPDVEKAKRIFDEKMITEGLGSFEYFRTFTYDARKQEEAEKQRREACDEPKNREACEREDKQALENAKPQQLQVKVLRNGKEVGERSK